MVPRAEPMTTTKRVDPFYRSAEWRALRHRRLEIDNHTCVVPGCGKRATKVDHIKRRRDGGMDALNNLRSLCGFHDNQVKEDASGKRNSGGQPFVVGSDAGGRPLDPAHPWNSRR